MEIQGAVGKIDASFHIDANGAANYQIPIPLPPGTAGMEPHLALAYDHQQGNGILGIGWNLAGLSQIERCSATIAQDTFACGVNYDPNDRFCLDGERLVNIKTGPSPSGACHEDTTQDLYFDSNNLSNNVYHTERESWRQVVAGSELCGQGPCGFTVTNKQGWTLEYGSSDSDSNPYGARVDAYRADGGERLGVRTWKLHTVTDRNGNALTITHTQNSLGGDDGIPCPAQLRETSTSDPASPNYAPNKNSVAYPCRVDYTANTRTGLTPQRHVIFGYEDRGQDALLTFQGGGAIETLARMTNLTTQVADAQGELTTVKTYTLTYDNNASERATWRSRLVRLEECGTDGTCYSPATTLAFPPYSQDLTLRTVARQSLPACESEDVSWTDFDGDGRSDWVCTDVDAGTVRVALARESSFEVLGTIDQTCTGGVDKRVDWGDFNGDGKDDWLCYAYNDGNTGKLQVAVSDGQSLTFTTTYDGEATTCTSDWMWADFNADGLTDWVCWETSNESGNVFAMLSTGTSFALAKDSAANGRIWSGELASGCSNLTWTDFDGDGLYDWVCNDTSTGQVWVFLSTGNTLESATGSSTRALFNQEAKCSVTVTWIDVSGDGLSDWTCSETTDQTSVYLLLSTGTDLTSPTQSDSGQVAKPLSCDSDQDVTWMDFNADGLKDWLCSGEDETTVFLSRFSSTGNAPIYDLVAPDGSSDGKINQSAACDSSNLSWGDFTGDGLSDWLCAASGSGEQTTVQSAIVGYPDLIATITNGFGGQTNIHYAPLTDTQIYTQGTGDQRLLNRLSNETYPLKNVQNAMYVVSGYELTNTDATYSYTYDYTYSGARIDLNGRGWMGFATRVLNDTSLQARTNTSYLQEFPWNGQVVGQLRTGCDGSVLLGCDEGEQLGDDPCTPVEYHFTYTAYYCQDLDDTCPTDRTFSPYPGVYQVLPSLVRNDVYSYGDYLFSLGQTYTFDTYGNQTLASDWNYVTQTWDEGNTADGNLFTDDDVFTAATYYNETESDWILGYRQSRTQCSALSSGTCDPSDASTLLKKWQTNYDYPSTDTDQNNGCLPAEDWAFTGTMDVLCQQRFMDHAGTQKGDQGSCAADGIWLNTTYARDAYGHAVEITDPAGNTTRVEYETTYDTFPKKTISAPDLQGQSLVTEETYSPLFGTRLSELDPNQNLFAWCYDAFGRPIARQGPNASSEDIPAEACPNGSSNTSPGGLLNLETYRWTTENSETVHQLSQRNTWSSGDWRLTTEYRDGLNRIWRNDLSGTDGSTPIRVETTYLTPRIVNEQTVPYYVGDREYQITTCYDSWGRKTRQTEPYQATPEASVTETLTTWVYSGDRCLSQNPDGTDSVVNSNSVACGTCGATSYLEYPAILVTETQAAESATASWQKKWRHQFHNSRQKTAAVTFLNNSAQTCFDHDRLARFTGLTDAIGAASSANLNSLNRPYSTSDSDLGPRDLCYDEAGRTSVVTDAKNQTQVMRYDGLNRVYQRDFYNANGSVDQNHTFVFDRDGSDRTNLMGHLSQVQSTYADPNRNSAYVYSYDAYGRATESQLTFGSTYTTSFEHDPLGRVTSYTYPDSSNLTSRWTPIGFLDSEVLVDANGAAHLDLEYPSYNSLGHPLEIDYGSATKETFTYYPLGQLATRDLKNLNDGTALLADTWTWDPLNSLTSRGSLEDSETYGYGATPACGQDTQNTRRLISVESSSQNCYDGGGNRTQAADVTYQYNPGTHQIAKATSGSPFSATYDPNGNIATTLDSEGTAWNYTVDTRNRLINATANSNSTLTVYDYLGRRLQRTDPDGTVTTYVSPRYVLSGSQVSKYVGDLSRKRGAILTEAGDAQTAFFYLDQVDSVVLATDATGETTARVAYDPWGNIDAVNSVDPESLRYTFNSKEFDDNTGLYFFEARHYDPTIARFITADTRLGGRLHRQDATNRYAMVLNNPLSFSDPTGHSWFSRAWHLNKTATKAVAHFELKVLEAPYRVADRVVHSTTGKLVLSAVLDGAEIGAGLALKGMGFQVTGSTLLGAGISGAQYTLTHRGSNFSWKGYGIAEASGAISGLVSGGLSEFGSGLVSTEATTDSEFATQVAKGAAWGLFKSAVKNTTGQATRNVLTGHSPVHGFNWTSFGLAVGKGGLKGGGKTALAIYKNNSAGTAGESEEAIEMTEME